MELLKNADEEKLQLRNKLKVADNRILDLERKHEQLKAHLPRDKKANTSYTQNVFGISAKTSNADKGNHKRNVDSSQELTVISPLNAHAHTSDTLIPSGDIEGTTPKEQTGSTYILHHPEPTKPLVVSDSGPRRAPRLKHTILLTEQYPTQSLSNRDTRSSKLVSSPTPSWTEQRRRELDSSEGTYPTI